MFTQEKNTYIHNRWSQLYNLNKESSTSIIKYLFTTNAGGSVAILAYLGTAESYGSITVVAVVCFFIGLFSVGIYLIYEVHHREELFNNFRKLAENYYVVCGGDNEEIEWQKLVNDDKEKVSRSILPYVLGYIAFLTFIIGCVLGSVSLAL